MILVTGGAGYIGSCMVRELLKNNLKVAVIDNLELGHKEALPMEKIEFFNNDFADAKVLEKIFANFSIEAVIHLAAYSSVRESSKDPEKYFKNNVENTNTLLSEMIKAGVGKIIFSSSASVYGQPLKNPITEDMPVNPISVYGKSKAEVEKILSDCDKKNKIKFISLRYFNAAGAEPDGENGEDHIPETHLIAKVLKTALGLREKIEILGSDYPTPDGTGIRDYIHIKDISGAHLLALSALMGGAKSDFYNVGSGRGYSVKQIINTAEKIVGKKIATDPKPRLEGDPAELVTNNAKIKKDLNWRPQYSDIETIVGSAWKWHKKHPFGYGKQ